MYFKSDLDGAKRGKIAIIQLTQLCLADSSPEFSTVGSKNLPVSKEF